MRIVFSSHLYSTIQCIVKRAGLLYVCIVVENLGGLSSLRATSVFKKWYNTARAREEVEGHSEVG